MSEPTDPALAPWDAPEMGANPAAFAVNGTEEAAIGSARANMAAYFAKRDGAAAAPTNADDDSADML